MGFMEKMDTRQVDAFLTLDGAPYSLSHPPSSREILDLLLFCEEPKLLTSTNTLLK